MKKLLILLCLPMIGFGQDSYEKSCWKITKKLDKFDDIITYDSPTELPIHFKKVIDNENNYYKNK